MNKSSLKKLSRRDSIKLLGAVTGATVLANLPTKWNTPEIASGVLPAHAQTSNVQIYSIECSGDPLSGQTGSVDSLQAIVTATQPVSVENIQVQVIVELTNPAGAPFVHATGFTDVTGLVTFPDLFCPFSDPQDYNLIFSFVDQATYGTATCTLGQYTFNGC